MGSGLRRSHQITIPPGSNIVNFSTAKPLDQVLIKPEELFIWKDALDIPNLVTI